MKQYGRNQLLIFNFPIGKPVKWIYYRQEIYEYYYSVKIIYLYVYLWDMNWRVYQSKSPFQ